MSINNNVVFITGGAQGIGLAIAEKFLKEKNTVIICDRNEEKLNTAKELHPKLITYLCDIANFNELEIMVKEICKEYTELNILVNNAGIQNIGDFLTNNFSFEKISSEIDINLKAPIYLTKLLLPTLIKNDNASIINVSSLLAKIYKESAPIYCATKAGLHGFSKSIRYQLEKSSVKVYEIMPPIIDTEMTSGRGSGKITSNDLVDEFFKNFRKSRYQVEIGKTKFLFFLQRYFPKSIEKYIRYG